MTGFLASFLFVFLAEMGDRTQLLTMAFALRFDVKLVMLGVLSATAANHFLAVLAGGYMTSLIPLDYVRVVTAASFILFGIWVLRGDRLKGQDRRFKFSPFWTVAVAFFLAEMGDKTQLATIALAARYQSLFMVWSGTTCAMVTADAIGIFFGNILGRKIPEKVLKRVAAAIFILFGVIGLYEYLPAMFTAG
ncbi:MAG: TMEM165/GDT1 family protein [Syntrophales bacterium]